MPGGRGSPGRMDAAVPWGRWRALVGPSCHSQARGRHARGAETMLRMCLLQAMLGLSGGGAEDAVLDSRAMQRFMRLGPMREQVPDATALAKLRHAPVGEGGASCRAGPGHMGVAERPEVASGPHPSPMRRTTARKPSAIEGLDCALPAESREGHRVQEGIRPLRGGASLPHREAPVRAPEDALQRGPEELLHALRILRPRRSRRAHPGGQVPRLPPRSCLRGSGTPCRMPSRVSVRTRAAAAPEGH